MQNIRDDHEWSDSRRARRKVLKEEDFFLSFLLLPAGKELSRFKLFS